MTAPLDAEQASGAATMFKALGDSIRLRLLSMIASAADGEVCVCDLTGPFDLSAPTISYHLKILREAGSRPPSAGAPGCYYRARRDSLEVLSGLIAAPTAEAHGV
ncbi:Arsenical resistance operon repressor OS=Streptomyces microflavus OX=1919 GN=Smic_04280 PE=4 SV=1 [Streptomyces microflavus]